MPHNFIRAHTVYDDLEKRQDDDEPQVDQAEDAICIRQFNAWHVNVATNKPSF